MMNVGNPLVCGKLTMTLATAASRISIKSTSWKGLNSHLGDGWSVTVLWKGLVL